MMGKYAIILGFSALVACVLAEHSVAAAPEVAPASEELKATSGKIADGPLAPDTPTKEEGPLISNPDRVLESAKDAEEAAEDELVDLKDDSRQVYDEEEEKEEDGEDAGESLEDRDDGELPSAVRNEEEDYDADSEEYAGEDEEDYNIAEELSGLDRTLGETIDDDVATSEQDATEAQDDHDKEELAW